MRSYLKSKVLGQERAINDVVDYLARGEMYLRNDGDRHPKGTFLFAGTPGVGKTYLAKQVAKSLGVPSLVLNMSTFNGEQDGKLALFGMSGAWRNASESRLLGIDEIYIAVDPSESKNLTTMLANGKPGKEVVLVCEDERLNDRIHMEL